MTGVQTILFVGAIGAVLGLVALHAVVLYIEVSSFRSRLKDDVTRRTAIRVFPRNLYHRLRLYKPVAYVRGLGIVTVGGALVLMVIAVFVVGLLEVFGI